MDEGVAVAGDKLDVVDGRVDVFGVCAADCLARLEAEILGRDVRRLGSRDVLDVAGRRDDAHIAVLGLDGGELHVAARRDADIARRRLGLRAVGHCHIAALRLDVDVAGRRRDVAAVVLVDGGLGVDRDILGRRHGVVEIDGAGCGFENRVAAIRRDGLVDRNLGALERGVGSGSHALD